MGMFDEESYYPSAVVRTSPFAVLLSNHSERDASGPLPFPPSNVPRCSVLASWPLFGRSGGLSPRVDILIACGHVRGWFFDIVTPAF